MNSRKLSRQKIRRERVAPKGTIASGMQQATRCSDFTAFFYLGELVEFAKTEKIFTNPSEKRTEDYITGRFG